MKNPSSQKLSRVELTSLFWRLRENGISLGVDDLLAALRLFDSDWKAGENLLADLKMLWLHAGSYIQLVEHDICFDQAVLDLKMSGAISNTAIDEILKDPLVETSSSLQSDESSVEPEAYHQGATKTNEETGLIALPTTVPRHQSRLSDRTSVTGPISRLNMAYAWDTLRQLQPVGSFDDIDLDATIDQVARERCFIRPILKRRLCNRARLLLLIDRRGSMGPFHHLTSDLVETAKRSQAFDKLDVRYFQNKIVNFVYYDPQLYYEQKIKDLLNTIDDQAMILVVSDAGAARGFFNSERIVATIKLIVGLQNAGRKPIWLNPMPADRWEDTSAEAISYVVPMYPLDRSGIFKAFRQLRNY